MMKLGMISGLRPADLDYVKSFGLECVEFCRNDDQEAQALIDAVPSIKESIARTSLPVASVGRWNAAPNDKGALNGQQLALQLALMDAAIELGSPVFVCGCNYDDSVSLFKNYSLAVEYFGRLLAHADGRIKVAAYNCDWGNFVHSEPQWEVVLGELPKLGIKFDCSHAINRGEDYLKALANWGDRIYHMHIKGTARTNGKTVDDPPAGMDCTDWGTVFAILYARGYDAALSLEPHSHTWRAGSELGTNGIRYAVNFTRKFIM